MSETVYYEFEVKRAVAYNKRHAGKFVDQLRLWAPKVLDEYDLSCPALEDFAYQVVELQEAVGATPDGKLGSQTVGRAKMFYPKHVVDVPGLKIEHGFDMHKFGGFRKDGNGKLKRIVIHWSATLSIRDCVSVLSNRGLSTHYCVGIEQQRVQVQETIDPRHKAFHCGKFNRGSIGIDLCTTPVTKYQRRLEKRGHVVRVVDNPTYKMSHLRRGRGDKRCLTVDSRMLTQLAKLVVHLCNVHGIPIDFPRDQSGRDSLFNEQGEYFNGVLEDGKSFTGICGHHHLTKNKWDVAPWWDAIVDEILKEASNAGLG